MHQAQHQKAKTVSIYKYFVANKDITQSRDGNNYASPTSGEAYRDRRLTTNFELWVEIFLCADMFPYEDSKSVSVCLSVRLSVRLSAPREKKSS